MADLGLGDIIDEYANNLPPNNQEVIEANNKQMALPNPLPFTAPLLPLKLTETNYKAWRKQVLSLVNAYDLSHLIDGSSSCPKIPKTGATDEQTATLKNWLKQDHLLSNLLISTFTEPLLIYIDDCSTSREVWTALETVFAGSSHSRLVNLRAQRMNANQGTQSITAYLHNLWNIATEIGTMEQPISPSEFMLYAVQGLREEFREVAAQIRNREQPYKFPALLARLVSPEEDIRRLNSRQDFPIVTALVA